MTRPTRRTLLRTILATVAMTSAIARAVADQPPDHYGDLTVAEARVTSAGPGGRSILHLRLANEGHDYVHLLGIETPVAREARIVGRISDHETATLESIGLRPGSELDLTGEHVWIELGPLTRPLRANETIPVVLVFPHGRLGLRAHVHSAEG